VLDVMMPVLDGWGVLEALQGRIDAPPVLVVSAKSSTTDIEHALSIGARGYLAKPFNAEMLLDQVRTLVSEVNGAS
jgi:DNA-binding response OmpR family regulator